MEKHQIIEEIRRTAKENGNRPLGARRFSAATGIRATEWLGKYWARWGDALREAGLEPNTLQGALEDKLILEHYAQLVRELGHIPVKAEFEMKSHRDPAFPNVHTIFRRLGRRESAVPKLIAFCEQVPGFTDVLGVCRSWMSSQPSGRQEHVRDKRVVLGYVYLLRSGRHYKIGRTNAVGRRGRELALQLPMKGEIIHTIATDDPAGIEAYWHRRFEAKRGNGEWFGLSGDDVAAFRRRKSM